MDTITIPVPPELAKAYREAPPELRRKWELIVGIHLRTTVNRPRRSLLAVMDELGATAARNGLTEEELQDILREWDEERKAARAVPQADQMTVVVGATS